MAVDAETRYYIQQAFAELRGDVSGAVIAPPPLTPDIIARDVKAAFAELDMRQLAISQRLTPAQRFGQVCAMNEFLRRAVIAAIHQQHPGISEDEFQRKFLQRMGIHLPP